MSEGHFSDERLRDELARVAEVAEDGRECPPAERIVLSGRDELPPEDNEAVIIHMARCTACATAWRIARDVAAEPAPVPFPVERARRVTNWTGLAAAAAILVAVVGAGIFLLDPGRGTAPVHRTQEGASIESAIDEGTVLARDRCLLKWTAGPDGTYYDIRIMAGRMQPLVKREGLDRPEFVVPQEILEDVASGDRILWHVTARLPDGRRVESDTFIAEIE